MIGDDIVRANRNYRMLFLPFMQIPSGHHQVADTLMHEFQKLNKKLNCDKVDILSYSYGNIERIISSTYLAWIKRFPSSYHWIYFHTAYKNSNQIKRNSLYNIWFTPFFKQLINEKKPDILFCTHALPSNLASKLKQNRKLDSIVVNVYTDYFINRVWGMEGVDYHLAPSLQVKQVLLKQGVPENSILVTGIPVHSVFYKKNQRKTADQELSVLVTGGNLGVGGMEQLFSNTDGRVHFYVLCGKNMTLYNQLLAENKPNVTPFPYITSKETMNQLYDRVDAVVTKPGGVTISECLTKRKPIFVYNPLPGQEKINAEALASLGIVMLIDRKYNNIEQQIVTYFQDIERQNMYQLHVENYHQGIEYDLLSALEQLYSSLKKNIFNGNVEPP